MSSRSYSRLVRFTVHHNVHPRLSAGALLLTSSLLQIAHIVRRHPVGDTRLETCVGNPHLSMKPIGWGSELSDWGMLGRDSSALCGQVLNSGGINDLLSNRSGRPRFCLETGALGLIVQDIRGSCSLLVPCGIAPAWYRAGKFQVFYKNVCM